MPWAPQKRRTNYQGNSTARMARLERMPYTPGWTKAAARFRREHPLCELCERTGRPTPAEEVDHIIPRHVDDSLMWDERNWQSLCSRCHRVKSSLEARGLSITWRQRADRWVISGKPATGKTTLLGRLKGFRSWDMDAEAERLGFIAYPRPRWQLERLVAMRRDFLRGIGDERAAVIVSDPVTAHGVAADLRATWHHCHCTEDERQRRLAMRRGT